MDHNSQETQNDQPLLLTEEPGSPPENIKIPTTISEEILNIPAEEAPLLQTRKRSTSDGLLAPGVSEQFLETLRNYPHDNISVLDDSSINLKENPLISKGISTDQRNPKKIDVKSLLRIRNKKQKPQNDADSSLLSQSASLFELRKTLVESSSDINFQTPPAAPVEEVKKPSRVILFRVKLTYDSYKTLTIDSDTTAGQLREKLLQKLGKERPDRVWDGCVLLECIKGSPECLVNSEELLIPRMDGREFIFKREGEVLINPEEELKQIIKQKEVEKQLQNQKKLEKALAYVHMHPLTFGDAHNSSLSTNERAIIANVLETISDPTPDYNFIISQAKLIQRRLDSFEEEVNALRKKLTAMRKTKKKNKKIAIDMQNVIITKKIAEPGGSNATVYKVNIGGWECAMKELILDGYADESSFLTEIRFLEALPSHDNIVQ